MFFIWKDAYQRNGRYDTAEFDLATQKPMVFGGDSGPHHPRGMRWGFFDWTFPGLKTAVQVDGTLDNRNKLDRGWQVEIALPWSGIERLDDRPLPPAEGATMPLATARCQVIQQRSTAFTTVWTPYTMAEGGLHTPEEYPNMLFSSSTPNLNKATQ